MSINKSTTKTVVQSTFLSNKANIIVKGKTNLEGASLATVDTAKDETISQNDNLNLSTSEITYKDLSNVSYSKGMGAGVSKSGSTANASLAKNMTYEKTKTLATLGTGNITLTNKDATIDERLNRDATNTNKDIVKVDTGVEIDVTVDTRLVTEDGRNQIKEDIRKTKFIADAIIETATQKSSSIIGDKANGETGIFQNIENKVALFDANKKFANDPENKTARETLLNKDASPQEIKQATNQLHIYLANEMGITPSEIEIILDRQYKGASSQETGKASIAANNHTNMGDLANTTINETSDLADLQRDKGVVKSDNYVANRDEYSENFGNLGQELLETQYAQNGDSINNTTYNQTGTNLSKPEELNKQVITNTQNFNKLDKLKIAHRQLSDSEIEFVSNKENIEKFAKEKYNTQNPTQEQLQGAKYALTQEGLRQVDGVWNTVLGKEDTQAKDFLSNNSNEFQKDKDFYNPTVNANTANSNPDIYQNAQDKAKVVLSDTSALKQALRDKLKDTYDKLPQALSDKIDEMSKETLSDFLYGRVTDIAATTKAVATGYEISQNIKNTPNETLDNIYGEGTAYTLKDSAYVLAATGSMAVIVGGKKKGADVKNSVNDKIFTKETFDAPSGKTYNFYGQDIDLDLKLPDNKINPKTQQPYTNREWMKKGNNPYILDN